jgi:lysophospholipase L1-like esterase
MSSGPRLNGCSETLLKIILVISGPLFLLALLEGVAYVWERGQANGIYAWEMVASRRIDLQPVSEEGGGYTLVRAHSEYEWQGIPVRINSHGLRGPETSYDKPQGTMRILNLGDSVAMGWGVAEEDSYGRQLEQLLNENAAGERRYEVINGAVPGWNLENAGAFLQAQGLDYEPDLILLDITLVNDIYGGNALEAHNRPAAIEWLRSKTHFWPFLSVQYRTFQARSEGRERIDVIDPPRSAEKYFPLDPEAERWTTIWNQIESINRLANENEATLILVLFPLEFQVLDESFSTLPQEILAARAAEAGIPTVDLLPSYRQACRDKADDGPCQLEDRYLFADVWMHPSAYGHKLTAHEIFAFLGQGLVTTE